METTKNSVSADINTKSDGAIMPEAPEQTAIENPNLLASGIELPTMTNYSTMPEMTTKPEEASANHVKKVKVAILSEDGFEEEELTSPKAALESAGAMVEVIAPHDGSIKGWNKTDWGKEVIVDKNLDDADVQEYDALVLPGGVMNPDKLRQNKDAVSFVKLFIDTGKPVAAICHGPQTLIETGMIEGKTMTSYPSLKTDLQNAGVEWVDKEMVHSGQFITSRNPGDLNAFNNELIHELVLG